MWPGISRNPGLTIVRKAALVPVFIYMTSERSEEDAEILSASLGILGDAAKELIAERGEE